MDINEWHGTLKIYVNGYEQDAIMAEPWSLGDAPLYIGGKPDGQEFAGRIDEVTLYNYALTASTIRDIFVYQGSWVEDRQNHNVTVDADPPTTSLYPPAPYWPVQPEQLLAFAHDLTSGIAKAELGVQAPGQLQRDVAAVAVQLPVGVAGRFAAQVQVAADAQGGLPGGADLQARRELGAQADTVAGLAVIIVFR